MAKTFKERLQDHWFAAIVLLCVAVTGITWQVSQSVQVAPRDFEIERLQRQLGELPPDIKIGFGVRATPKERGDEITILEATLKPSESAITVDGECMVKVVDISGSQVRAEITMLDSGSKIDIPNWTTDKQINTYRGLPTEPIDFTFTLLEVAANKAIVQVTRLTKPTPVERLPHSADEQSGS